MNDARFVKYWHMGGREEKLGLTQTPENENKFEEGKVTEAIKASREEPPKA